MNLNKKSQSLNLYELAINQKAKICRISDDFKELHEEWIESMGLAKENIIYCIKKETFLSPGIYKIGNFSIAMSKDVTVNIQISYF